MGRNGHSYSAARAAKSLGLKVLLITDVPQTHEMLYSDALIALDPLTDLEAILKSLADFRLIAVCVSIKHLLLPAQARIAEAFDLISVGTDTGVLNNNKLAWRDALAEAGVAQPAYGRDPKLFEHKPCIRKPISGTGSAGVIQLGPEDDKVRHAGPDSFFEAAVAGDQYDYEGVVEDGKPRILVRVFERYILQNGTFAAHFFLFNPVIDPDRDSSLTECAVKTLAASRVVNGAFHVEMRMDGKQAVPIDFANRMGYERFVSFASGEDFAKAHVNCFLPEKIDYSISTPKPLVQYFCWTRESFDVAERIRQTHPSRVFDSYMKPHKFAGEPCEGMIVLTHDSMDELLALTKDLGVFAP